MTDPKADILHDDHCEIPSAESGQVSRSTPSNFSRKAELQAIFDAHKDAGCTPKDDSDNFKKKKQTVRRKLKR
ncbi:hypothetical protein RJZ56_004210 [Blastomyces dermatitidis]